MTGSAMAAWLVAVAGMLCAVARLPSRREHAATTPIRVRMLRAMDDLRLTEGRLSGLTKWSASPSVNVPERAGFGASPALLSLVSLRLTQDESSSNPEDLAGQALAHLVVRRTDDAIVRLEHATGLGRPLATHLNDLSVAYLERARLTNNVEDLPRALDAASRAIAIADGLVEAWFNRALSIERLGLSAEAIAAWEDYRARERSRPWRDEAARRSASLRGQTADPLRNDTRAGIWQAFERNDAGRIRQHARTHAQLTREVLEEQVLPRWAEAILADRFAAASGLLDALRTGATALAEPGGDRLALDTALALAALDAAPRQRAVAAALLRYDRGRRRYDEDRFLEAQPMLHEASEALEHASIPFAVRASFQYGLTLYYAARMDDARAVFASAADVAARRGYHSLAGRAGWLRGLMRAMPAGFDDRVLDYTGALGAFERAREGPNTGAVHLLLAETFQVYGDPLKAWDHRQRALLALGTTYDRRRRHAVWLDSVRACLLDELPAAARWFADAMLREAEAWGRASPTTEAYRERARIHLRLGDVARAREDAESAARWLARVPDATLRARLEPFVRTTRAEVLVDRDPAASRDEATAAIESQRRAGRGHYLAELRRIRARSWVREGRTADALAELELGIREMEDQRRTFQGERARIAFLDETWPLFRDVIALQVGQRGDAGAFDYAERGRARALLDRVGSERAAMPLTLEQLQSALPPDVTVVSYLILDDRLMIWCVRRDAAAFVNTATPRAELGALVAAWRSAVDLERAEPAARAIAGTLFDRLVGPVASLVRPGDALLIVPDGPLWHLPFGALFNRTLARYVIEDHRVVLSPSASSMIALSRKLETMPRRLDAAIAIVDETSGPGLPALPAARQEARAILRGYRRGVVREGGSFPKAAFVPLVDAFPVVHFAGHAIADNANPDWSRLVLSAARLEHPDAILRPADLVGRRFDTTQVLVLAACRTGAGRVAQGEGALTLAHHFLHDGVPVVVASLWDVDDAATARLMQTFHARLAAGGDAADALQHAQRELLRTKDGHRQPPAVWAGFQTIGGLRPANVGRASVSDAATTSRRSTGP